jgi:hypothetical protein
MQMAAQDMAPKLMAALQNEQIVHEHLALARSSAP